MSFESWNFFSVRFPDKISMALCEFLPLQNFVISFIAICLSIVMQMYFDLLSWIIGVGLGSVDEVETVLTVYASSLHNREILSSSWIWTQRRARNVSNSAFCAMSNRNRCSKMDGRDRCQLYLQFLRGRDDQIRIRIFFSVALHGRYKPATSLLQTCCKFFICNRGHYKCILFKFCSVASNLLQTTFFDFTFSLII